MPSLGALLIALFLSHCTTMAFVSRGVTVFQLRARGYAFQSLCTVSKAVSPRKTESKKAPKMEMAKGEVWVLQFDGGSRGNPGVAGSGSVLYKADSGPEERRDEMWYGHHYIGEKVTNNVAEYTGLIEGLKQAVMMNIHHIHIQGDSQLIIKQVQGLYKVKHEDMKRLHSDVNRLLKRIPVHSLEYVPRAQNSRADELSNFAMDTRQNVSVTRPVVASDPCVAISEKESVPDLAPPAVTSTAAVSSVEDTTVLLSAPVSGVDPPRAEGAKDEVWVLQFDGGSRGNPGVAGSGSVLYKADSGPEERRDEMWYGHHYIGEKVTNNVAEYTGLIEGLKQAVMMNIHHIHIQGDSQLIIKQVQGLYKVKHEDMKRLHSDVNRLLERIPVHSLEYIPRAQNSRADELSNFAMDTRQNVSVILCAAPTPYLLLAAKIEVGEKVKVATRVKKVKAVVESDGVTAPLTVSIAPLDPTRTPNAAEVSMAGVMMDVIEGMTEGVTEPPAKVKRAKKTIVLKEGLKEGPIALDKVKIKAVKEKVLKVKKEVVLKEKAPVKEKAVRPKKVKTEEEGDVLAAVPKARKKKGVEVDEEPGAVIAKGRKKKNEMSS